jgi:hypothetical protein
VQRLLQNPAVRDHFNVTQEDVLADLDLQRAFFYRVFPSQVDQGSKKPATMDWCMSRTKDGTGQNAPREFIHLLSETRNVQLNRYETGQASPEGPAVFERQAFKDALPTISKVRLEQTLYAEHPTLRPYVERLEGQKTRQNAGSLAVIWGVTTAEAEKIAEQLVVVGFFEPRLRDYWVPFLYRPALAMVQGSAEGVASDDEE